MMPHVIRLVLLLLLLIPALVTAQIGTIPSGGAAGGGGAVGGASNLTTVGAIPYVSASGVLNQDATNLFWDATNHRLGVGTASPNSTVEVSGITGITGGGSTPPSGVGGIWFNYSGNVGTIQATTSGSQGRQLNIHGYPLAFKSSQSGSEIARFSILDNLLIGGTTDGNYKLDVQKSGSTGTLRVYDQTATTGITAAIFKAGAGQGGNNIIAVQNAAGANNWGVDEFGNTVQKGSASAYDLTVFDQTATTGSTLAVVRAGAGQSGNLTEWQNSAGTVLGRIDQNGSAFLSTAIDITTSVWALQSNGLTQRAAGQIIWSSTSNYQGTADLGLSRNAAGVLEINNGTAGTLRDLKLRNITVMDTTAVTGSTLAIIQAGAGQSGNLTEWRNNAGTRISSVGSGGELYAPSLQVISGGSTGFYLDNTNMDMKSTSALRFSNDGNFANTKDTGLARAAAGYLKVTDGSTGLGKIVVSQSTPSASSDACTAGAIWADATYIYACTASGTIKRATLATF